MTFGSTRGNIKGVSFSEAVLAGIAPDGGLFVPEEDVLFDDKQLKEMATMDYCQLAVAIFSKYATDYTAEELTECVTNAYIRSSTSGFAFPKDPAPLHRLNDGFSILELWHGPTCAFKDMALQILPEFMKTSTKKKEAALNCKQKKTLILTATSGDTGKAALEGFMDAEGISIMVFYPKEGVSLMQKTQMITQEGSNVSVVAVNGNFDDAQTGVKNIFSDVEFAKELAEAGYQLSSANSINIGRLLPQIVYYFHAYFSMVRQGTILLGDKINFVVPTGNFGNILAAYYAKESGLPINRIICATNSNNVVSDFIKTGTYDSNRDFLLTISPAMDILISSNLERLIYRASGNQDMAVREYMKSLKENGSYSVDQKTLNIIQDTFWASSSTEADTQKTIKSIFDNYSYLIDTHTAVAVNVYDKYVISTGDTTPMVAVSTASPFKFNKSVAESLVADGKGDEIAGLSEFQLLDFLSDMTDTPIPVPLKGLDKKAILHKKTCAKENMKDEVISFVR